MMNMNMGVNMGMNNMNQIYMQMNQLMMQIMNNINIVLTNMNQLMANMNQMNNLINEIGNKQINNNNINNFNNMINMDNIFNLNPMNFNDQIKHDFDILFEFRNKITLIQCNSKDKLSDVINKYELKSDIKGKKKYVFNGQVLNVNDDVTVENSGISHCGRVLVIKLDDLIGGYNNKINKI